MGKSNFIIEINNLCYKDIINNVNMKIPRNSFVAISGSSSSGKTTLLKLISMIIPTLDTIKYNSASQNDISSIFLDEDIIYDSNTLEEEFLKHINENIKEDKKKYKEIVKLLKLEDILLTNPNSLNTVDNFKFQLGLAIYNEPKVLLIDDLCFDNTQKEINRVLKLLKEINKRLNITIIITTNDLENVVDVDYLYILHKGEVYLEGVPKGILREDNKLSRIGLSSPFMYDLSTKLMDYDLIDDVILDMDGMVDKLWK